MDSKVRIERLTEDLSTRASNILKYSRLPPHIREVAVAKFGFFGDNETPLVLVLASRVKRGSTGWLLTDQGLYWKQPLAGVAMHLAYANIQGVQLTDQTLTVQGPDAGFRLDLSNTLL
jgi:hypothetical protein